MTTKRAACISCGGTGKCNHCGGVGHVDRKALVPIAIVSGSLHTENPPISSRMCFTCMGSGTCQDCMASEEKTG